MHNQPTVQLAHHRVTGRRLRATCAARAGAQHSRPCRAAEKML